MTNLTLPKLYWDPAVPIQSDKVREQFYQSLVNSYHGDLYRYAYWLSKDHQQAEDVVQETFLRAWRSLDKLRDVSSVKAWLFTIVRNENARLYRRYRPPMKNIEDYDVVDASTEVSSAVSRHELQSMIMSLDENFREPLLLQIIGGFSINEIADMLDMKLNTVLSRLFRARSLLKQRFGSPDGTDDFD